MSNNLLFNQFAKISPKVNKDGYLYAVSTITGEYELTSVRLKDREIGIIDESSSIVTMVNGSPVLIVDEGGGSGNIYYAICTTSESSNMKTINIPNYTDKVLNIFAISFTDGNTANSFTLSINNMYTRSVSYENTSGLGSYIKETAVYLFIYDGSNYVILNPSSQSTEVVQARRGFNTLNDRLNSMTMKFNDVADLNAYQYIKDGDFILLMGGESINDGNQGIYQILELDTPTSIPTDQFYELVTTPQAEGNHVYACQLGGFGGGGGGGTTEGISLTTEISGTLIYLKVNDPYVFDVIYKSGTRAGTVHYFIGNVKYQMELPSAGRYTISLPQFAVQGSYTLRVYAIDSSGRMSNELSYVIRVGDLSATITTTTTEYLNTNEFVFRWNVVDIYNKPMTSHITFYDSNDLVLRQVTPNTVIGSNAYNFGQLAAGYYSIELYVKNTDGIESRKVRLNIRVSSVTSIVNYFTPTSAIYTEDDNISVAFVILYNGITTYVTKCYIDDILDTELVTATGTNIWAFSSKLIRGTHTIKIKTTTAEGLVSETTLKTINVKESTSGRLSIVSDDLIINMDSRTKNNSDVLNRNTWGIYGNLHNFDYKNYGWSLSTIDDTETERIVLKTDGNKNYVDLDFCPFHDRDFSCDYGMTFDIKFRNYDLGNPDATIAECLDNNSKGFSIRNSKVYFNPFGSIYSSDGLAVRIDTNIWHKVTFIVARLINADSYDMSDYFYYTYKPSDYIADGSNNSDVAKTPVTDLAIMYIDGIIAGVISGNIEQDYSFAEVHKIYLGAHYDDKLRYATDFAKCDITNVRLYQNYLTTDGVLQNFIADVDDMALHESFKVLNDYNNGFGNASNLSLPILYIDKADLSTLDAIMGPVAKDYMYPNVDVSLSSTIPGISNFNEYAATIKVQGTSSTNYSIKNYKLTTYKYTESQDTKDVMTRKNSDGTSSPPTDADLSSSGMYLSSTIKKLGSKKKIIVLPDWLEENTYTLKADYMESSHSHNTGLAKFLHTYFEDPIPPRRADSSNPFYNAKNDHLKVRTSIDGFPVILMYRVPNSNTYINHGIYNFNIDKGNSNVFGYSKYEDGDCLSYEMANNNSGGAAGFNLDFSTPQGRIDAYSSLRLDFEVRYHPWEEEEMVDGNGDTWIGLDDDGYLQLCDGTINENGKYTSLGTKFNPLHGALSHMVQWVARTKNNPDIFKAEVGKHFNLSTLEDYYLMVKLLGMVDNLGKNTMITTWNALSENIIYLEDGSIDWVNSTFAIWYPQFYDMDTQIALSNDGHNKFGTSLDIEGHKVSEFVYLEGGGVPSDIETTTYNTSDSILWVNLKDCFLTEIKDKYKKYRGDLNKLSPLAITNVYFSEFTNKIGGYYYNRDALNKYFKYAGYFYMCQGSRKWHIKDWIDKRFVYMDSWSGYNLGDTIIFRNTKRADQESLSLAFGIRVSSPIYLTIQYQDNDLETKLCSTNGINLFEHIIGASDANMWIDNKSYITELTGLRFCQIEDINLSNARQLKTLDLGSCSYLKTLSIGNNNYMQKIDISNTPLLSSALDVSSLKELISINAMNSGITNITYSNSTYTAQNIESIDISNSSVKNLICDKLGNLKSIGMINLSEYTYSTLNSLLDTYYITEENRELLLDDIKNKLILGGVPEDNLIGLTLESAMVSYGGSSGRLGYVFVPGLVYLAPIVSINSLTLAGNTSINAVHIAPTLTSVYAGTTMFNLSNMPSLNYLYVKNVSAGNMYINNNDLRYVYLYNCTNVINLDLYNAEHISYLNLYSMNNMINLKLSEEVITNNLLKSLYFQYCGKFHNLMYGATGVANNVDLKNMPLTDFSIINSYSIEEIVNINVTSSSSVFRLSDSATKYASLLKITGTINVTGTSMASMFYGQNKLVFNLGSGLTINMSSVTSLSTAFYSCKFFSWNDALYIMSRAGKVTSFSRTFQGTNAISATLPANFFSRGLSGGVTSHPAVNIEYMLATGTDTDTVTLTPGVFNCLTNVTNMNYFCIAGSTSLNKYSLSDGILTSGNVSVTKSRIVGTIPDNLFDKCTKLATLLAFFSGGRTYTFNDINQLFRFCPNISTMNGMFEGSTLTLTSPISKEFFGLNSGANRTLLTDVSSIFKQSNFTGSNGIIPNDFFGYITNLRNASYAFYGCTGINGFGNVENGSFLRNKSNLTNISFMFWGTDVTGPIPNTLLPINGINDMNAAGFLGNCTKLGTYDMNILSGIPKESYINDLPYDFFYGQYYISDISYMFYNDTNLCFWLDDAVSGTQVYRFKDCRKLNNINGLFYKCTNLIRSLPTYGYVDDLATFYTESEDDIPVYTYNKVETKVPGLFNAFDENGNVICTEYGENNVIIASRGIDSASYVFAECIYLEGLIPGNIFYKFYKIRDLSYSFYRCRFIGNSVDNETSGVNGGLNGRRIPYGIFDDCINLEKLSYTFSQCPYLGRKGTTGTDAGIPIWNIDYDLYEQRYDEKYFMPKYLFRYNLKLSNIQGIFSSVYSDGTSSAIIQNYYGRSYLCGVIYKYMLQYNTLLTNVSYMLSYAENTWGYPTANATSRSLDYEFFKTNINISDFRYTFYDNSTNIVRYAEPGVINFKNHKATGITFEYMFHHNFGTIKAIDQSYCVATLVYMPTTNTYVSSFEAYGSYTDADNERGRYSTVTE